ncbi:AAA ATPase, putative [Trypanosoma cruzi]|nr:AAA ATPase, putative [Trypanosoma cruzi]
MTSAAPLFAITGRGNDVKHARELIASIGGVLTTKEQVADYLVVVKGAGRRRVEEYCQHHHHHHQKQLQHNGGRGGGNLTGHTTSSNGIRDLHSRGGRLLLLDMLEQWSTRGKVPERDVSVEELEGMNLLSSAGAERDQRFYDIPEGFLKRSRVTLDPHGNAVDEADNSVLVSSRRAAPPLTATPPPPGQPETPPALLRPPMVPAAIPLAGAVVFKTPLQHDAQRRGVPRDDESAPQKAADDVASYGPKNNGVVNPMRAAFQRRPKPEWDTYFADAPGSCGAGDAQWVGNATTNKKKTNDSHSSSKVHVAPQNRVDTAAAAPSPSECTPSNQAYPSSTARGEAAVAPKITRQKKNGVELTFDISKRGTRRPEMALRGAKSNSDMNAHESTTKKRSDEKATEEKGARKQQQETKEKKQEVRTKKIRRDGPKSRFYHSALNSKPGKSRSVELPTSRQSKVNHDDAPCRRTAGSGVLASDGSFGPPPPLPPRPHESSGLRSTTGAATTTTQAGCKSTPAASQLARTLSTSTPSHPPAAAAAAVTTKAANNNSTRVTHGNSLLQRVRQSSYCKGIPEETCLAVLQQVVDRACPVSFSGISGLEVCKRILYEAIILPAKCPQLFTGLRRPCSGLLLFGPPGNGKTLLARAVSRECDTTFFSISAAAITSKWVGESEKMVRALFAVARALAPSTIFVDEIDALLQARGGVHEGEGSRRIKTEFLVQMDGAGNDNSEARVLVMGATNRPFDLDEAIIRRFPKRVFVPLPDAPARTQILQSLLDTEETPNSFTPAIWQRIVAMTDGYSGHDLRQLCEEAAMIPVRDLLAEKMRNGEELTAQAYHHDLLRPLTLQDVETCIKARHPSCCPKQLKALSEWSDTYGSS